MRLTTTSWLLIIPLLAGIILGCIGGPVYILLIWAAVSLTLGGYSTNRKAAILYGAIFGFTVSYVFMIKGYSGPDPLPTKLLPFLLFGGFGAACGTILSFLGHQLPRLASSKDRG